MDLCHVEGEKVRSVSDKRLVRCHRYLELGHYAYKCSIPRSEPRGASAKTVHQFKELEEKGPMLLLS